MEPNFCPKDLPGYGSSMQAAAIASALVERGNAHILQRRLWNWLDRFEEQAALPFDGMEAGRLFAGFLTNLARVGADLKPSP